MSMQELLSNAYYSVEDAYYSLIESIESATRIPLTKYFVSPIEKSGIPSFPVAVIFFALICSLIAIFLSFTGPTTYLQAQVYSKSIPLSNALVEVYLDKKLIASGSTAIGKAFFDSLPQTVVTVLAKKNGYEPNQTEIDLSERSVTKFDLNCLLEDCKDVMDLKQNVSVKPIPRATAVPLWSNPVTDSEMELNDVCLSGEVNCDELTDYIVPEIEIDSFSLMLLDASTGETISAEAKVSAFDSATEELLDETTSSEGFAYFPNLMQSTLVYFTVIAQGFIPYSGKTSDEFFEVTADSSIMIFLEPLNESNSATTFLTITDLNGEILEGVQVDLYSGGNGNWQWIQTLTVDGMQELYLVAGGSYSIVAYAEGYKTLVYDFTAGEDVSLQLTPVASAPPQSGCYLDYDCLDGKTCFESVEGNYCEDPAPIDFCQKDADCAFGEICRDNGACEEDSRECVDDSGCSDGQFCSDFNSTCVIIAPSVTPIASPNCIEDETCLIGQVCQQTSLSPIGECADPNDFCVDDSECSDGLVCRDNGLCETNSFCSADLDCPNGFKCDNPTNSCVPLVNPLCVFDSDCSSGEICSDANVCVAGPTPLVCSVDSDCSSGFVCNIDDICIEPNDPRVCPMYSPPSPDWCIDGEVITSYDEFGCIRINCLRPTPSPTDCVFDSDCSSGEICSDANVCVASPIVVCSVDSDCPSGFVCNIDDICIEPNDPRVCPLYSPPSPDWCIDGEVITSYDEFGCILIRCARPTPSPTGCVFDSDCSSGEICTDAGACVVVPSPSPTIPPSGNLLEVTAKWFRPDGYGTVLSGAMVNLKVLSGGNWFSCGSKPADGSGKVVFDSCLLNGVEMDLTPGQSYKLNASYSPTSASGVQLYKYYAQDASSGVFSAGFNSMEVIVRPYLVNLFLDAYSIPTNAAVPSFSAQAICIDLVSNNAVVKGCSGGTGVQCGVLVDSYSPCSFSASASGFQTRLFDWEKIYDSRFEGSHELLGLIPLGTIFRASLVLESVRELSPNPHVLSSGEQMRSNYLYRANYLLSVQDKTTKLSPAFGLFGAEFNSLSYSINPLEEIPGVFDEGEYTGVNEFVGSQTSFCDADPAPAYYPDGEAVGFKFLWLNFTNDKRSSNAFSGSLTTDFYPTQFNPQNALVNLTRRVSLYQEGADPEFFFNPPDSLVYSATNPKSACAANVDYSSYSVLPPLVECNNGLCLAQEYSQGDAPTQVDGFEVDLSKKTFFVDVEASNFDLSTGSDEVFESPNAFSYSLAFDNALVNVSSVRLFSQPNSEIATLSYSDLVERNYFTASGLSIDLSEEVLSNPVYSPYNKLLLSLELDALSESDQVFLSSSISYSEKNSVKNGFVKIIRVIPSDCTLSGCSEISFSQQDQGGLREWSGSDISSVASLNDQIEGQNGFVFSPLKAHFELRPYFSSQNADLLFSLPSNVLLYPGTGIAWRVKDYSGSVIRFGEATDFINPISVGEIAPNQVIEGEFELNTVSESEGVLSLLLQDSSVQSSYISGSALIVVKKRYGSIVFKAVDVNGDDVIVPLNITLFPNTLKQDNFVCNGSCSYRTMLLDSQSVYELYSSLYPGFYDSTVIGLVNFSGSAFFNSRIISVSSSSLPTDSQASIEFPVTLYDPTNIVDPSIPACDNPVISVGFFFTNPVQISSSCSNVPLSVNALSPFAAFRLNVTCPSQVDFPTNYRSEGYCLYVSDTDNVNSFDVSVDLSSPDCVNSIGQDFLSGEVDYAQFYLPVKCGAFESPYQLGLNVSRKPVVDNVPPNANLYFVPQATVLENGQNSVSSLQDLTVNALGVDEYSGIKSIDLSFVSPLGSTGEISCENSLIGLGAYTRSFVCSNQFLRSDLIPGSWQFNALVNDANDPVSNSNSASMDVTIDSSSPMVSLIDLTERVYQNDGGVSLVATANDESGIKSIHVFYMASGETTYSEFVCEINSLSSDEVMCERPLSSGELANSGYAFWFATAYDNAGGLSNYEYTSTSFFNVLEPDVAPPSISALYSTPFESVFTSTAVELNAFVSDQSDLLSAVISYSTNVGGTKTVSCIPTGFVGSSSTCSAVISESELAQAGVVTWSVTASDVFTNEITSPVQSFTVLARDTSAPVVSSVSVNPVSTEAEKTIVLTASATDAGSGVNKIDFSINESGTVAGCTYYPPVPGASVTCSRTYYLPSTAFSPGSYSVSATATDFASTAGNSIDLQGVKATPLIVLQNDLVPPVISLSRSADPVYSTSQVSLTAIASDSQNKIKSITIYYSINSGSESSKTCTNTNNVAGDFACSHAFSTTPGQVTFRAVATDSALPNQNTGSTAAQSFTVYSQNSGAPNVVLTGPSNSVTPSQSGVTLSASATDSDGIKSIRVSYAAFGKSVKTTSCPFTTPYSTSQTCSVTLATTDVTSGLFSWSANATDAKSVGALTSNSLSSTFFVLPTVQYTLTKSENSVCSGDSLTLTASATTGGSTSSSSDISTLTLYYTPSGRPTNSKTCLNSAGTGVTCSLSLPSADVTGGAFTWFAVANNLQMQFNEQNGGKSQVQSFNVIPTCFSFVIPSDLAHMSQAYADYSFGLPFMKATNQIGLTQAKFYYTNALGVKKSLPASLATDPTVITYSEALGGQQVNGGFDKLACIQTEVPQSDSIAGAFDFYLSATDTAGVTRNSQTWSIDIIPFPVGSSLYVGGCRPQVNGVTASNLAAWNGINWRVFNETIYYPILEDVNGVDGGVNALLFVVPKDYTDPYLVVGGDFDSAGAFDDRENAGLELNLAKSRLMYRNDWTSMESKEIRGVVKALAEYNGRIYAAGSFGYYNASRFDKPDFVPNLITSNIISTDLPGLSTRSYAVGNGINGRINALAVYNNELYAAGLFTSASGVPTQNIARWNGNTWMAVGSGGVNGEVYSLIVYDNKLYAGGSFTMAGGVSANNLAYWDASAWRAVVTRDGANGLPQKVTSLAVKQAITLYVASERKIQSLEYQRTGINQGYFWSVKAELPEQTVVCHGDICRPESSYFTSIAFFQNRLYAGGKFSQISGVFANNIAKYDFAQGTWSSFSVDPNCVNPVFYSVET